ncbi:hypothetical protein ACFWIJ_40380 [Streptomyces sp. NPDC127079]|uniref:hypothetical protein n=1 Tax=Streptomyces sp. NPDC127079 TaxID=3347132 RepID=UPI003658CBA4
MSVWADFGFTSSPYAIDPIPATREGEHLLVGRDAEIRNLVSRLESSARHPTIEGPFGVGKTSLIRVACFRMQRSFNEGKASINSLIPLKEPIELYPDITIERIQHRLFCQVAEAFRVHKDRLEATGRRIPKQKDIERWLNDPVFSTRSVGASLPLGGVTVGKGSSPNSSSVYSEFGFPRAMKASLESCFPECGYGGFVGVIDNMELMRTSQKVRDVLDYMRDNILAQEGLRWILCGAQGVIRSAAATPRLGDTLGHPIEVNPIADELTSDVIARRIDAYKTREDPVVPIGPDNFWYLYDIFNRNLRTALKFAEEFSLWLHDQKAGGSGKGGYQDLLEAWVANTADRYRDDAGEWLEERDWVTFDALSMRGGTCRPCHDFGEFGFESSKAMRSPIRTLKDANLLTYEADEIDKRRKIATMTAVGWLVAYARAGYNLPPRRSSVPSDFG